MILTKFTSVTKQSFNFFRFASYPCDIKKNNIFPNKWYNLRFATAELYSSVFAPYPYAIFWHDGFGWCHWEAEIHTISGYQEVGVIPNKVYIEELSKVIKQLSLLSEHQRTSRLDVGRFSLLFWRDIWNFLNGLSISPWSIFHILKQKFYFLFNFSHRSVVHSLHSTVGTNM